MLHGTRPVPRHVAVLGLGPSVGTYLELTKRAGGRRAYCDETWSINALGDVFNSDIIFHMDDVRIQEVRAAANPQGNIAAMLSWMRTTSVPIMTSRKHADYPSLIEFPLSEVIGKFGYPYFNSTAAYAIAYAAYIGVQRLSVFGFDFTYANAHHAEKGRACVEFWLGIAAGLGIRTVIPHVSSLMDACNQQEDRLYGYDTLDVTIDPATADAPMRVTSIERSEPLPTAAEIESRYDHNVHPNALVKEQT